MDKNNRIAVIASLIPRDIFESQESWLKEVDKVMGYKGMSDADIKAAYDARKVVQQAQAKVGKPKVKSASTTDNKDSVDNSDNDNFELPDWIPSISDSDKISSPYQVKSASISNNFPVPDISHSVTMCVSRERRNAEELTDFLSMFEGIHS
ncbi:MAG: hypothetical protein ACRD5J_19785 [Nitrososphaeraceae archaeon]